MAQTISTSVTSGNAADSKMLQNGTSARSSIQIPRFEDFYISDKTGFVLEQPLTELPAYFEPWNEIGRRLPELLQTHSLRDAVGKMPLLDHNLLSGYRQRRLAYTILSFVGNGYVWQDGETGTVKTIPRQLAIPWNAVSSYLGLHPAVCHTSGVLSNWKLIDPSGPSTLDNLQMICAFPGGVNCQWFFLVTGEVERNAVPGLKAILKAKESVLSGDTVGLSQSLDAMADNILLLKSTLAKMHEKLDADVFYNVIRPFLTGWGGNNNVMPNGLIFEGVSDEPNSVIGGSAAQSSTIQCYDAALGIVHDPDKQQFLDVMRTYMPPAHASFIDALRQAPSIRDFVAGSEDKTVAEAYSRCVKALAEFRSYHIQITTKYVVSKAKVKFGTGGTELMPFLKGIRDSTSTAASLSS